MKKVRDPVEAQSEMVKGLANFWLAIGVGIIGFALLEPAIKDRGDYSGASAACSCSDSLSWRSSNILCGIS